MDNFKSAIRTLGELVSPGVLILVETTVPPGTCEQVVVPILRDEALKRGVDPASILVAHSYERVMPGPQYFNSIVNFWRVFAGATPEAADACRDFLSKIINVEEFPLRELQATTASETAKVLENSYRAVNIAFMEEWGRFAETMGIDLFEVIAAIRDRPTHNNIRQPGFSVGGYCLTKDPLFAGFSARQFSAESELNFPFSFLALETNRQMPIANLDRLEKLLGSLKGKTILLMGVAYRSEVDDTRNSGSEIFLREAVQRGAEIRCHDPFVNYWSELDLHIEAAFPAAELIDAVVFAVPHTAYCELDVVGWLGHARPLVYDCDNVFTDETRRLLRAAGHRVESTGRGDGI
jgi:UDP-N-acetyl-D-glucosamine dehydrogenase